MHVKNTYCDFHELQLVILICVYQFLGVHCDTWGKAIKKTKTLKADK